MPIDLLEFMYDKNSKIKMKKSTVLLIVIFSMFLWARTDDVFAVQGTCSDHRGVSCNTGTDWDGSPVCNDGWRDSNEIYSQVQECKIGKHYCSQSEMGQIKTKYSILEKTNIVIDLQNQLNKLILEAQIIPLQIQEEFKGRGVTTGGIAPIERERLRENSLQQLVVNSSLSTAYIDYARALNSADAECNTVGESGYKKMVNNYIYSQQATQVLIEDPLIDYKTSAYENIRNRKIYRDVLNSMNLNSSTICEKLGFLGENLIMCQAYRTDILNKESWKLIDRVNTAVNTQTAVVSINSKASSINVPEVKDGALVRAAGSDDIYIVKYVGSKKFKRLILSPSVFNSYGHLKWGDVLNIDKSILDSFTASNLVRAVNDPKVYVLSPNGDAGERHWVSSESAFKNLGLDWDSIYEINEKDRDSYVNSSSY